MIDLQHGEEIILVARKHWLLLAMEILGIVGTVLAGFLAIGFAEVFLPDALREALGPDRLIAFDMLAGSGVLLVGLMTLAVAHTNYYLDTVILTNMRIIDNEQRRIFSRNVVTVQLENIADIKVETRGVLQTFLRYGTLQIQTAGAAQELVIRGIDEAESVRDEVVRARQAASEAPKAREQSVSATETEMPQETPY